MRRAALLGLSGALAGGILAAGCGSTSAPTASPAVGQSAPGYGLASASAAAVASAPSGPFKITALYCGKFSTAQQDQYADYSGLIFRYVNVSNSVVGSPDLTVNFTKGSAVLGSNVNGSIPTLSPGQSATGDVGAVSGMGETIKGFTGCQMVSYGITTSAGGQPGTYTP